MPFSHHFKPSHKEIKRYYEELAAYATHEVAHEGATSSAFQNLLATTGKKADWHLVPQLATRIRGKTVRPDGTLRDQYVTSLDRFYVVIELARCVPDTLRSVAIRSPHIIAICKAKHCSRPKSRRASSWTSHRTKGRNR